MADKLLDAVIRLENQIQQQLQLEQTRAAAWLDGVRGEQEADRQAAEQALSAENERLIGAAKRQAEAAAAALIADEMHYCNSIEELSDDILLEVLKRQLVPPLVNSAG